MTAHLKFAEALSQSLASKRKSLSLGAQRPWAAPNDEDRHSLIVRSGLLALHRSLAADQRRLVALRYPGDIVSQGEKGLAVTALVHSEIEFTSAGDLLATVENDSELRRGFDRSINRSQLIAYEWLTRDAMDSNSRLAHFLCEHHIRLGLSDGEPLPLEMTQVQLAEITAQTAVNVNRVLGNFVKQGLLSLVGKRTYKVDWPELHRWGRFDPAYLTF